MKRNKLSLAVTSAMGIASIAGELATGAAYSDEVLEEIVVVGSLIKKTEGFESSRPVVVASAEEIHQTGISKIEDFLSSLPQISTGDNSYISNGASGNATVNLRGMGSSRTLVLINGRRMGAGGAYNSSAADVNQIPTAMIDRIEVLTGGASTVYGAYAVAGVVNFVLRDEFEGVELTM